MQDFNDNRSFPEGQEPGPVRKGHGCAGSGRIDNLSLVDIPDNCRRDHSFIFRQISGVGAGQAPDFFPEFFWFNTIRQTAL